MSGPIWLLGVLFSVHPESIATRVRHLRGPKIPAILNRLVKNIRINSNTMELFIRPSEKPKENWSAVSACSVVNHIPLTSLAIYVLASYLIQYHCIFWVQLAFMMTDASQINS